MQAGRVHIRYLLRTMVFDTSCEEYTYGDSQRILTAMVPLCNVNWCQYELYKQQAQSLCQREYCSCFVAGEDTAFAPLVSDLLQILEGKGKLQVGDCASASLQQ